MGKFKDLVEGKKRLDEAVGGVVSTPAINQQGSIRSGSKNFSGDSRIDTGGQFTFRADELPGSDTRTGDHERKTSRGQKGSDFRQTANPRQAFEGEEIKEDSVVLHQDDGGSVTLREGDSGSYEVIVRAGSQERIFELEDSAATEVMNFFE